MRIVQLLLVTCVLLSGCVKVTFPSVIGDQLTDKELKELTGTWIDSDKKKWIVERREHKLPLLITSIDKKEQIIYEASVTTIEKENIFLWVKDHDSKTYLPLRLIQSSGNLSFTLLIPDEKEVEKLIKSNELKGVFKNDTWLLEEKGNKQQLMSKTFWSFNVSLAISHEKDNSKKK